MKVNRRAESGKRKAPDSEQLVEEVFFPISNFRFAPLRYGCHPGHTFDFPCYNEALRAGVLHSP